MKLASSLNTGPATGRSAWLEQLTAEAMSHIPFPRECLLHDAVFYPASGIDGSPIRHWTPPVDSFVYVDLSLRDELLCEQLDLRPPKGYRVLASRRVSLEELAPGGWWAPLPPALAPDRYRHALRMSEAGPHTAFARWTVLERRPDLDAQHGPRRFSLLVIRAEGLAAFDALYRQPGLQPAALALLRPGEGFGGNFDGFEAALAAAIEAAPGSLPRHLLQWHRTDDGGHAPAAPWDRLYGPRATGPLTKDGEPHFRFSVYEALG